ncbi:MAG TPA: 3-oxoacyl-[acyl-carrier-protein] reductase [Syntrophales bacterium]|nr:3-oxoacyl-[acyl-carrier-protein] reductase [Syntrophales bacterium]HOO00325.1 3-oxoacyl-[acyl-carrier-protein] reductase [Syntrophales bacterium]HPC01701.1 3-oxoacyl-[acyl-carrier-protein] reductase [Syntrophales bacterium]HRV43599.1 3-oxoacyl-[acyl-carrier-protein] reductase [Syntrophales bacterium]
MTGERVALVTGGSRGIGRAVSLSLAKAGFHVCVNYVSNEQAAEETLSAMAAQGGKGEIRPFDVRDEDAVRAAVDGIIRDRGGIDVLVNNAGIWRGGLILRVDRRAWDEVLETNLRGAYNCCRAVIRHMMKRRWGRIINMSSLVGEAGNIGDSLYSLSKAGIIGLTKSLAREVGSRNICVNAVAPGWIETDMTSSIPEEIRRETLEMIPLGRLGTPEDVAGVVTFLASEAAGYITGEVIRVNGGLYM